MKNIKEIYDALETNDELKELIPDIKEIMGGLRTEAQTSRESKTQELSEMQTQIKSILDVVSNIQGTDTPVEKPEDVNLDVVTRQLAEMKEATAKTEELNALLETANRENESLAITNAMTKIISDKVRPEAIEDFMKLHQGNLIKASDGKFQTKDGIEIEKYIDQSLEKQSYFRSNPIPNVKSNVGTTPSEPGKEMTGVDKINQRISELQRGTS